MANTSALKWLKTYHPEIYEMYKQYDKDRRRKRARDWDQIKRDTIKEKQENTHI